MRKIRTIEKSTIYNEPLRKLRVCAYVRVSTNQVEQQESFYAQVQHYTSYINSNPEWTFAGIYSDNGLSGKNAAKRPEFMRMVQDAENRKFDLIITKSISRFARNTQDCLETVRKLKFLGIAVQFEKEGINTLTAESELMLSILSSVAEEELASITQNMHWSNQRRFRKGKFSVSTKRFLGYDKGQDGNLIINEVQAVIVRRIFTDYLSSMGAFCIAKGLEADGIENISGKIKWAESSIRDILKNEKYMGEALLQKTFTIDFLTKKRVKNSGQAAQYYVENSHPPIVSKEEFAAVQMEFERRANMRGYSKTGKSKFTNDYAFSGKLFCQNCSSKFRRTKWGKGKNQQIVWICINHQMGGNEVCNMKTVKEKAVEQAFLRVMNGLIGSKEAFLIEEDKSVACGVDDIDARLAELLQESMNVVRNMGIDNQAYSNLATEIDRLQAHKQRVKGAEAERV